MDKSDNGVKFGFNKSNNQNNEQIETESSKTNVNSMNEEVIVTPKDDDAPYTDSRYVTIELVKNFSLYRKVNDKVLPKRQDFIGSSITSSRTLAANKEEIDKYFPNIIGLSPADPNFIKRVKNYLNNIRIPVDELGKKFDVSFYYYHKHDYNIIKAKEEEIEEVYNNTNKQDTKLLKKALREKINRLNNLESSKCRYGYPINTEDYLMYRHCLLYNDVAKDIALINSDSSIRFYFKDDQKEAEKLRKFRTEVLKAKSNYVKCLSDDALFEAVYIQYCVMNNLPVMPSLSESSIDREIKLDKFSTDNPVKFNKICNNADVKLVATIEKLIAKGELIRSQYNQNITAEDGTFVGANINEAVAWFKNPNNTSLVNVYINKLKNN